MADNKLFDDRWMKPSVIKATCREKLFGDSSNPLAEKIKKKQKHIKESLMSDRSVEYKSLCFNADSKSKPLPSATEDVPVLPPSANQFISQKVDQDKQKKKKKQKRKRKKQFENVQIVLSENLLDVDCKSSNLMAELLKASKYMVLFNKELYVYQQEGGYYKKTSRRDVARDLRSLLEYEDRMKVTTRQYQESYEQLLISEELDCEEGFFENQPYVNCLNGVVDVLNGTLLEHSPDYRFKHCINANYLPDGGKCKRFLEYVDYITLGDKELKALLRAILGYIFSHYNNAKKAVLLYGIPHTGKSVLCSLTERILGSESVCHVDLTMLQRQEYAAVLSSKLLNVAPDLKNEALRDVGFFKSLVSHDDTIAARALYDNPKDIKCETKMLFSSNHLLTFDGGLDINDILAVFNRLIYFPFQNSPIRDFEDNKHLSDDLYDERDQIFTWAMKGLKEYIDNNETFPKAQLSEDIKRRNMSRYCPEKTFFEECIKFAEGKYESSGAIKEAFAKYCVDNKVLIKSDITDYLELHHRIPKTKKRIDSDGNQITTGNPIHVYKGIRLKKQFRTGGIE